MTFVLDADVVIGALDGANAHHGSSRELLAAADVAGEARMMSVVNLTEVLVRPGEDPTDLRSARQGIALLGIRFHTPGEGVAVDAARLRAAHPISLPDAYVLATARHLGARVASFDRRLRRTAEVEGLALA